MIRLNILYFIEPRIDQGGGVNNVAYYLPRALANKIGVTYFPAFIPRRSNAVSLLNVFKSLAMKDFDIVHFNVIPSWTNGRYMLLKFAKINGASTILNIHGIIQIEYMLSHNLRRRWFWLTSYKGLGSTLRH